MQTETEWRERGPNAVTASPPIPMPALMWRWLNARGFTTQRQIEEFFKPSLKDIAHPFDLKDMDKAVGRMIAAFTAQERVCVYGDYDMDGSSGIALLVAGLKGLGYQHVSFYQPSRFLEGYGIHSEALEVIAKRGDKVVISVDCGITAVDEAKKARDLGLDLIITDHHLARKSECGKLEELPNAFAVVNPNQKGCDAQLGHISGVGVGFYLLLGIKSKLASSTFDLKSLLDLFTIGTITDMVPLKRENRVLVKHGLKVLSRTERPGLQALLKRLNLLGRDLDSTDVAFTLAPKLNALSRLEMGIRPLDVLMCDDFQSAEVLAEQVIGMNDKRKSLQAELEEKILAQFDGEARHPCVVLAAEGHAGVVGLVATKIAQLSGKPSFIVARHNGEGVGSARGKEDDCLPDALATAQAYLERFGGHAQAAGFSLKPENFDAFKAALLKHYEARAGEEVARPERTFDTDAALYEFNANFMDWLKHAGPFGSENPTPLFRVVGAEVAGVRWLKGQHLKMTLIDTSNGARGGARVDAMAFFAHSEKKYQDVTVGQKVELLAEPSWNYFRGDRTLQLMVRDLRRV